MNLDHLLITANRGLNVAKIPLKNPTEKAVNLIKCLTRSTSAEIIFGDFFGSGIYRYTRHMTPVVEVQRTQFGDYISSLQFYGGPNRNWEGEEGETHFRVSNLNRILQDYDYKQHSGLSLLDLSSIEKMKFKV